jgi:hypothetical protein
MGIRKLAAVVVTGMALAGGFSAGTAEESQTKQGPKVIKITPGGCEAKYVPESVKVGRGDTLILDNTDGDQKHSATSKAQEKGKSLIDEVVGAGKKTRGSSSPMLCSTAS